MIDTTRISTLRHLRTMRSVKLTWILTLIYIAACPWLAFYIPNVRGHNFSRVCEVFLMLACTGCMAYALWHSPERTTNTIRGCLASLIVLAVLSAYWAAVPVKAAQEIALWCGAATISISIGFAEWRHLARAATYWVVASTAFYNAASLLAPILGMVFDGQAINVESLALEYENRRFFNHVQTIALPLTALAFQMAHVSSGLKFSAALSLCLGFSMLFLTGGRGTIVGLSIACVVVSFALGRLAWRCMGPLFLCALVGIAIRWALVGGLTNALGLPSPEALADRALDVNSVQARLYLWGLAADYIRESPWIGIGPMHYANRPTIDAAHPHNVYLQLACEWGIPAALLLCVAAFASVWKMYRSIRSAQLNDSDRRAGGMLLVASLAALVDGFFSGNFVMPVSQVWIALAAGLALCWYRSVAANDPPAGSATRSAFPHLLWKAGLVVLVTLQVWAASFTAQEFRSIEDLMRIAAARSGNEHGSPRFWLDGWF